MENANNGSLRAEAGKQQLFVLMPSYPELIAVNFNYVLPKLCLKGSSLWKKYLEPVHHSTRSDGDNDDCGEAEELESDNCYFLREELAMSENDHHCGTLATVGVHDPGLNYQQRLLFNVK